MIKFKNHFTTSYRNVFQFIFLISFLLLIIRFFHLISLYSVNIPFWDQWDYFHTIWINESYFDSFLYIHAPHRQGIAFVIDRFFLELSDLDTRVSSYLIGFIYVFASIIAIYIKRRLLGSNPLDSLTISILFLSIGFYETMIITPNSSHGAFPILLILLMAYICILNWNDWFKLGLFLLLNFFAVYTGFAFFIGIITPFVFIFYSEFFRTPLRKTQKILIGFFISILILFSFFLSYKFHSATDCFQF